MKSTLLRPLAALLVAASFTQPLRASSGPGAGVPVVASEEPGIAPAAKPLPTKAEIMMSLMLHTSVAPLRVALQEAELHHQTLVAAGADTVLSAQSVEAASTAFQVAASNRLLTLFETWVAQGHCPGALHARFQEYGIIAAPQ